MIYLAYIESAGYYSAEFDRWIKDFRKATWYPTLEAAKQVPAEFYLAAEIVSHTNQAHSKKPLVIRKFARHIATCAHCGKEFGGKHYNQFAAEHRYLEHVSGDCITHILISLRNASNDIIVYAKEGNRNENQHSFN